MMSFSFIEIDLIHSFKVYNSVVFNIFKVVWPPHTALSNCRIFSSHPNGTSEKPMCMTGRNRTGHGTTDWFTIGEGVHQGCIWSRCLFNFYTEYIMLNAGLDGSQAGIKIARRNTNSLRYADDTALMAESEKELKSLLKGKEESEKAVLKFNIEKTRSSPISWWQINGGKVETVTGVIFLGSKFTEDRDCSHEIKKCLLLGRKAMTNLDNILKRDITLPTKVHLVKAMVFPVVMYGCEGWTIKTAECWRIDAFELWCWRRLESPLDYKIKPVNPKGNQSWIFLGKTDAEREAPILSPRCEEPTHWKGPCCWERLRAGEGARKDETVGWHVEA